MFDGEAFTLGSGEEAAHMVANRLALARRFTNRGVAVCPLDVGFRLTFVGVVHRIRPLEKLCGFNLGHLVILSVCPAPTGYGGYIAQDMRMRNMYVYHKRVMMQKC